LFTKIRNDFGEMSEEERKIEQLRTIEQGDRICYVYGKWGHMAKNCWER